MNKKRRANLDKMLVEWSHAQRTGLFDEIGWHGGIMAAWIEFGGMPPKGTGNDQSNTGMVIAVQKMRKLGLENACQVQAGLTVVMTKAKMPTQMLMLTYLKGQTKKKLAREMGIDYEAFCVMVDCAQQMLAMELDK